ncbi:MAG: LamG domain-containing protein [Bacteroidales bacterium]|nr:LamG domain-containing protein [Bacteroidales bacterium]
MKKSGYNLKVIILVLLFAVINISLIAQKAVKEWHFEKNDIDSIKGYYDYAEGVSGDALKFDGFTTEVIIPEEEVSLTGSGFSIEAWVALGAYPWNKVPLLARENKEITGFFFGIDSHGRVGLQLSDGSSTWHECWSEIPEGKKVGLELKKWYHVACTFNRQDGMKVFVNGGLSASNNNTKRLTMASDIPYRAGRNNRKLAPTDPVRAWATFPSWYSLDGIIDELKLYNESLDPDIINQNYKAFDKLPEPAFEDRRFPSVKPSGRFGANYTKLEYYEGWDRLWPVGPHSDVVVQFEKLPVRVMFWRGTRYSACWVTENGKWMADQSRETGGNWFLSQGSSDEFVTGCVEHMSDVQCRSSRVAIIENNDARVVVHWRYLQMDVRFRQIDLSDNSGFGQSADEYYYIYPDGVATRKLLPGHGGWQETIFLNEPGTRPEDNVHLEAVTLVNMDGVSRTYSWEEGFPEFDLQDAVIQVTNLKSDYKPFIIFREGVRFRAFNGEVRPEYSHFPWWNHWPVAQISSDGRYCIAADRASHSSLSWGLTDEDVALYGMTDKPAGKLALLARSWNNPPELKTGDDVAKSDGYDYTERIYKLKVKKKGSEVVFNLEASEDSPICNPAFEISNWGDDKVRLYVNGREINESSELRYGIEYDVEGNTKLIVFVEMQSEKGTQFRIIPENICRK